MGIAQAFSLQPGLQSQAALEFQVFKNERPNTSQPELERKQCLDSAE
jgi:hypothetical protein